MESSKKVVWFLSCEWLLYNGRPNGGGVVVTRSIWVGTLIILMLSLIRGITFHDWIAYIPLNYIYLQGCKLVNSPEGPAIYGATYAALYARFVSQWTYIANLYNLIKQVEVAGVKDAQSLAEWKAGFIEDALELHLASKPVIKGIIQAWSKDTCVRDAFKKYAPESNSKWRKLQQIAGVESLIDTQDK